MMFVPRSHAQAANLTTLLTRPERTQYRETSTYDDVIRFVDQVAASSSRIHVTTFGYSLEGRPLPVIVVGDIRGADPDAVRASGKTRVFVQANIHAGEVCGKEAVQILLRQIAAGEHGEWLDSLVLIFSPIYNADGNERVRLTNRPGQHGPVGGMGQRANAQGLDLNRDHMKLESPEARSLVAFMNRWDPHVLLDLHTTNGTRRAYQLLYAPGLHPDTDSGITDLLRREWLPAVTQVIKDERGWDYYYYGNLPWRGSRAERGWYTFDHRARFNTNYIGLRNRFAILSEAYAYATFEDRINGTRWFVEEVVDFAYRHASSIRTVVESADRTSIVGRELTLRAVPRRSPDSVTVLLGEVTEERNPYTGRPMYRRLDVVHPERMPEFGAFRASEASPAPVAYLVPAELTPVLRLLADHGVRSTRLTRDERFLVERFVIDSTTVMGREFQGHRERTVYGSYEWLETTVPGGTVRVPVAQPLGRLAFALLEPRADDGVVNWNVVDESLDGARYYPILRVPED
jgi:hypothetical protein